MVRFNGENVFHRCILSTTDRWGLRLLSFSNVFDVVSEATLYMKRFGCKDLENMMVVCQKLLMKRVYHGKCKPRVGCPLSRVGGRLQTVEENALIRLCKSAKCSVLHVSCTRHTASWNCTDMARQSGKDERKDVLISGSSFPSGCYWLIMGLDWSPPSALTLGGSNIITKIRKTGIFKMQP